MTRIKFLFAPTVDDMQNQCDALSDTNWRLHEGLIPIEWEETIEVGGSPPITRCVVSKFLQIMTLQDFTGQARLIDALRAVLAE